MTDRGPLSSQIYTTIQIVVSIQSWKTFAPSCIETRCRLYNRHFTFRQAIATQVELKRFRALDEGLQNRGQLLCNDISNAAMSHVEAKTRDTKWFKEWNCTNSDWIDIDIQDHIGHAVTKLLECVSQIMSTLARNTIKTEPKLKECQRMLLCYSLRPCSNALITQIAMPDVQRKFDQLQTRKTFCQHAAQSWTTMISKASTQVP